MTTTDTHRQYQRLRVTVRLIFALGVAISLVANVLHANPNPISQAVAAWAPLALFLAVELISRVPTRRKGRSLIRVLATTAVAAIAAWVSYWHMVGVATRYGETGITPYLLPISVDGLIVVASISLVEVNHRLRDLHTTTTTDTEQPTNPTPSSTPANPTNPANPAPASSAFTIPAETAHRLAALHHPAPTTPAHTARHNGTTPTAAPVQEPLL